MAEAKKPVATLKTAEVKAAEVKTEVKAAEKKVEVKAAEVKAEVKDTAKKAATTTKATAKKAATTTKTTAKKAAAKTTATAKKAAEKTTTTAKKAAEKVAAPKATKAAKETIHVQFSGKSYTTEDLVKIAKDVWKYDLGRKDAEFKSVELYVKPEESTAYYVINGDVAGSFLI